MQREVRRAMSHLLASGLIRCAYLAAAGLAFPCLTAAIAAPDDGQAAPQRSQPTTPKKVSAMKVLMSWNGTVIASATLDDNESARHLATLLPLNLVLKDYAATEKIAVLPSALPTSGAPAGYKPSAGDLSYYAPWGNLAIFHKEFEYSSGLIRLGRLETGLEAMRRKGPPLHVMLTRELP
jgi:hypothetical protein